MRYFCFLLCTGLSAQEIGELSTERPGFTATSGMVGLGVLQLEQGYTFASTNEDGSRLTSFAGPQALVRYGIAEAFELRFSSYGYSWQTFHAGGDRNSLAGPNDSAAGAKIRLFKQTDKRPEVSFTGALSLPSSGSPFTTSGHDPSFTLAAYKDLPDKFSFAANLNAASVTDPRGRFASSGESVWAARSMRGGASLFAEAFHTTVDRVAGSQTVLDAGVFQSLGRNVQIDFAAGHTVAGAHPSWFVAMGCVMRVPRAIPALHWRRSGD
jgi:hypothetical protein